MRLVKEAKWIILISRKNVENKGMNAHPCSNAVSSHCVVESFIAPLFTRCLGGDIRCTVGAVFIENGMLHIPFVLLLCPSFIMTPYL